MIKEWIEKGISPNEWEVKALLRKHDIPTPKGIYLEGTKTLESIVEEVKELNFPLAAKVCDSSILHKTDVGGVKLGLSQQSWVEEVEGLRKSFPQKGLLLEEMLPFQGGSEMIVGATVDPQLGPALMLGAGGILTELYQDVSFRLIPITCRDAHSMIEELVIGKLFKGYRGMDLNFQGLTDTLCKISTTVEQIGPNFSQLDINPLVFCKGEWVALDGVLILNRV